MYRKPCRRYKTVKEPFFKLKSGSFVVVLLMALMASSFTASCSNDDDDDAPSDITRTMNVLFVGNSIAQHSYREDIGWLSDWGMAATKRENDVVQQLQGMLKAGNPSSSVTPCNIAVWERDFTIDIDELLSDTLRNRNAVVIMLGENVLDLTTFKTKINDVVDRCLEQTPMVVIVGCFIHREREREKATRDAAERRHLPFVSLLTLETETREDLCPTIDDTYYDTNGKTYHLSNPSILGHPNDMAMKLIAKRIYKAFKENFKE